MVLGKAYVRRLRVCGTWGRTRTASLEGRAAAKWPGRADPGAHGHSHPVEVAADELPPFPGHAPTTQATHVPGSRPHCCCCSSERYSRRRIGKGSQRQREPPQRPPPWLLSQWRRLHRGPRDTTPHRGCTAHGRMKQALAARIWKMLLSAGWWVEVRGRGEPEADAVHRSGPASFLIDLSYCS